MHRAVALVLVVLVLAPVVPVPSARAEETAPLVARLPEPLVGASAVTVGASIYVLAGRNATQGSSAVHRFDGANVARFATLPAPADATEDGRESAAAFALGTKVYLVGGAARVPQADILSPGVRALDDIIELDTLTGIARKTADSLPTGRFGLAAGVVGGKAYIVGGYSVEPATYHASILVYDPAAPEGARVSVHPSSWPAGVRDARIVATNDSLLVLGGQIRGGAGDWACPSSASGQATTICSSDHVARFEPSTGNVTLVARLPARMTHVEAGLLGNAVHVLGGLGSGVGTSDRATRIELGTWNVTTGAPIGRVSGSGAVAPLDDTLYRFGGRLANDSRPLDEVRAYYGDFPAPGRPLMLSARPEGNGTRVSWSPPPGSSSASILYRLEVVAPDARLVFLGNQTSALDNTTPGEGLRYRLTASLAHRASPPVEVLAVAGQEPLVAPDAHAIGVQGHALLSWSPVPNASGYGIERDGARIANVTADARSYDDPDGAGASYVVRALAPRADGLPGGLLAATPVVAPALPVASLAPSDERASWTLALAWEGDAPGYEVLAGPSLSSLAPVALVETPSHRVARVTPGATVHYAVRAAYGDLRGPMTAPLRIDPPPRPVAPGWIHANASADAIELAWEDVGDDHTLWRDGVPLATGLANATFVDRDVEPTARYRYHVTAEAQLRSLDSPAADASLLFVAEELPPSVAPATPSPATPSAPAPSQEDAPVASPPPEPAPPSATPVADAAPSPTQPVPAWGLVGVLVALLVATRCR